MISTPENLKLFCLLLGATPKGRNTEQHDILFTISDSISGTLAAIINFWPEAKDTLHIDCWREVKYIDGCRINILSRDEIRNEEKVAALFFLNLGGYKKNEFEEFHYKIIKVAGDKSDAIRLSKKTTFYMHTGFKGAESHIDDKFGIDIDDVFEIEDILSEEEKRKFKIVISPDDSGLQDELHLGYLTLKKLEKLT